MIKWVISDMDGTLLVDEHNLPADFPEVMAELKKAGIIFSPASGRQFKTLENIFEDYKKDMIFIAENGTYVSQNNVELFSATLPQELVVEVLARVAKMDKIFPIVSCKEMAYYNAKDEALLKELNIYYKANTYVQDFAEIDTSQVIKLAFCSPVHGNAKELVYEVLLEEFKHYENMQIVLSGPIWVDINPAGINKGMAIKQIQEKLGIKPEECMAFGDYLNDLEMMKAVKYSYAMANAVAEIKAAANYSAPANTESGVTKVIKAMLANGKEPVA